MKRLALGLWVAAAVLLGAGAYFSYSYEAASVSALQGARARASAATPRKGSDIPSPGAAAPVSPGPARAAVSAGDDGNTLRVKSAPLLPDGRPRTARFSSKAPSPEANAAEAAIRIRIRYHAMYAQLGLSPEEITRFEAAMRNKNFATDVFTTMSGMKPEEEERYREYQMLMVDELVRDALGESQVAAVRRYIATADLQEVADKLATHSFASGTPLTAAQADQLVQTCLALRSDPGQEVTKVDPRSVDWAAVVERAGAFLAPAQLTALRAMVDQREFDRAYSDVTGGSRRPPVRNF